LGALRVAKQNAVAIDEQRIAVRIPFLCRLEAAALHHFVEREARREILFVAADVVELRLTERAELASRVDIAIALRPRGGPEIGEESDAVGERRDRRLTDFLFRPKARG